MPTEPDDLLVRRLREILGAQALQADLRRACNQVLEWLRDCPFESGLQRRIRTWRDPATPRLPDGATTYRECVDAILKDTQTPIRDYGMIRTAFVLHDKPLIDVLEQRLFSQLEQPYPFTLAELLRVLRDHLIVREEEFDAAWRRCISAIVELVSQWHTGEEFEILRTVSLIGDAEDFVWQHTLTGGAQDTRDLVFTYHWLKTVEVEDGVVLKGQVYGPASEGAIRQLQDVVRVVSYSACRSSQLLGLAESGIDQYPLRGSEGYLDEMAETCTRYLDLYFSSPKKKDSLQRRLQNAVHFLAEVDRQAHSAVALGLSMAAIEAMLPATAPEPWTV